MATTAFITHADCALHDMGDGHPESPARLAAINDALIQGRVMDLLQIHEAQEVTLAQLSRVHSQAHIDYVYRNAPQEGVFALDADTHMNPFSLQAACYAAGAVVQACDLVLEGRVKNAFCAVRPPGHHAERERAMGFCVFNNIAVGAAHAIESFGLERVAIIDFDVHHGNGTEDIFQSESRVLLCSSYQHPFYPYSGAPSEPGKRINIALPAGVSRMDYRAAVSEQWWRSLRNFDPQCIFISAGFDAHKLDPLANLNLLEEDFAWLTVEIKKVAEECCDGRIISSLEGGYDLHALGASVKAHITALLEP